MGQSSFQTLQATSQPKNGAYESKLISNTISQPKMALMGENAFQTLQVNVPASLAHQKAPDTINKTRLYHRVCVHSCDHSSPHMVVLKLIARSGICLYFTQDTESKFLSTLFFFPSSPLNLLSAPYIINCMIINLRTERGVSF